MRPLLLAAALLLSCADPVPDARVEAQGNEVERVPVGELHRAGKQCVVCHREGGEASDHPFTVAGTVFAQPNRAVGVGGVEVLLTDSDGTKVTARTNCVGNFFVRKAEWQPRYPIIVDIQKGTTRRSMRSAIGREGDCAACHKTEVQDPLREMGHIYLYSGDEPGLPDGDRSCAVDPRRPGSP